MTFFPIVERELRLAARRKGTFRVRSWTAILGMLICFFSMFILWINSGSRTIGHHLFATMTGYAFGLSLLAGVFLTADCLSEEKREGTLGLLFLTDLHGYDVVLGKFAAMLLSALYALLTLLPITALPLILGGVTGGEFWRVSLALINALFFSLAAGIWISALVRDSQQAMGRTFALILVLTVALPIVDATLSAIPSLRALGIFTWVSPYHPFNSAAATSYFGNPGKFWWSFLLSNMLGWIFLVWASQTLPYRWQEGTVQRKAVHWFTRLQQGRGSAATRQKAKRDLLPINPILWLVAGEKAFGRIAWSIVVVWGTIVLLVTYFSPEQLSGLVTSTYLSKPFGFLLKFVFALQVCRFFVEARRNGTLEMLLCTPLTNSEIVRGQAKALLRTFLWPMVVFISLLLVPILHQIILGLMNSFDLSNIMPGFFVSAMSAFTVVRTIADFLALFWFGLWLSLTMKKPNFASALTVLLVLVLPSFVCGLDIFIDLFFILFGMTKLKQDLRWVVANQFQAPTELVLGSKPSPTPVGTS
jgi:ABC-type transport system involved in multi-copper enzyme maturation permease subunit